MAVDAQALQTEEPSGDLSHQPAVTIRSVGCGLIMVIALDTLAIYVRYVLHASLMTYSHVPMAMLIVLVVMLISLSIVGRYTSFSLSVAEWHTVLAMGIVGAALPCFGTTGYLIGYITAPYYFATEENAWSVHLHPYVHDWLIPSNEGNAVAWFYEGLPSGAKIPWDVWVLPLFWWTTVMFAAFIVMGCLAAIFRKQWVQNERLVFPAMSPLLDLVTQPGDGKRTLPAFFYNRMFLIGFGIAFGMLAWNCINYFLPGFPRFPIFRSRWYWIDRQMPPIRGFLGIFTIFFAYFASLDVLFSIWFFDLLFIVQGGWLNQIGYRAITPYYYTGVYAWQTRGAFVVLVASMFWVARSHLRDVVMCALGKDDRVNDRDELLSYRTALLGLTGGLGYLYLWLLRMNFDAAQGLLLLVAVVFVYVGVSKIIADAGLPFTSVTFGSWGLVAPFFGNRGLSFDTQVAFRFSNVVTGHFKALFLPSLTHAGRIAEGVAGERRKLMGAISLAFVVSFMLSTIATLNLGYSEGAYNFNSWEITRAAERHFQATVNQIKKPDRLPVQEDNPENLVFFGLGGVVMAGLIVLRHRFVWWPLHPVGMAISGSYLARRTSFSIFMTWLIKLVILKVGGPAVYRNSRPLFIGLLVGYILGVFLSILLDTVWFPERGHWVHKYG